MKGADVMLKKNVKVLEIIMSAPEANYNKDHELLIRIDERLNMICTELSSIKQMQLNQQNQSNENKKRIDNLELTLYGTKNVDGMYQKLEKHDKLFDIKDNVVKLPIKWHVIAHYCLAMATLREDDINSFFTLVGDYSKPIQNYTFFDVQTLAQLVEENAQPNSINHYVTQKERKELYKEQQKEYKKKWEEEHKDEIEERKRKQHEYAKKMREEFKKNAKRNK